MLGLLSFVFLLIFFQIFGFVFKICGKLLGLVFGLLGFLLIFGIGGAFIGLALTVMPVLAVVFLVWLVFKMLV